MAGRRDSDTRRHAAGDAADVTLSTRRPSSRLTCQRLGHSATFFFQRNE